VVAYFPAAKYKLITGKNINTRQLISMKSLMRLGNFLFNFEISKKYKYPTMIILRRLLLSLCPVRSWTGLGGMPSLACSSNYLY
jgi:hypothetical protein